MQIILVVVIIGIIVSVNPYVCSVGERIPLVLDYQGRVIKFTDFQQSLILSIASGEDWITRRLVTENHDDQLYGLIEKIAFFDDINVSRIIEAILDSGGKITGYGFCLLLELIMKRGLATLLPGLFEFRRLAQDEKLIVNWSRLLGLVPKHIFSEVICIILEFKDLFGSAFDGPGYWIYRRILDLRSPCDMLWMLKNYPGEMDFPDVTLEALTFGIDLDNVPLLQYALREFLYTSDIIRAAIIRVNKLNYAGTKQQVIELLTSYLNQRARTNQTTHDFDTEESIQESIEKLQKHYLKKKVFKPRSWVKKIFFNSIESLSGVTVIIRKKIHELKALELLNDIEFQHAMIFLNRLDRAPGTPSLWREEEQAKTYTILDLAYRALQDIKALAQSQGHRLTTRDHQEVWASWVRSAIVDSEVAYALDKGKGIPSAEDTTDMSCEAGSNNRLIAGLNLIHPDVMIREGDGAKKNRAQWKTYREKQRVNELCQSVSDLLFEQWRDLRVISKSLSLYDYQALVADFKKYIIDSAYNILDRKLPCMREDLDQQKNLLTVADQEMAETLIATLELIDVDFLIERLEFIG